MQPYTTHENDWMASRRDTGAPAPHLTSHSVTPNSAAQHAAPFLDDAVIRRHMRRGERLRALEVKRCVVGLFRLPARLVSAVRSSIGATRHRTANRTG
jgi:hypothetical protein